MTTLEKLRRRQAVHDHIAAGQSRKRIAAALGHNRETIARWLEMPRPSDTEIEQEAATAALSLTIANEMATIKGRVDASLAQRFVMEAQQQNVSMSMLIGLAAQLYVDAVELARGNSTQPINLKAYLS